MEYPTGSGNFVDVGSGGPHECIINVGDCLQQWTGLTSARHRVHMPKEEGNGGMAPQRFSIAYFGKPDRDTSLAPLIGELDEKKEYMTAGEFQQMRIAATY